MVNNHDYSYNHDIGYNYGHDNWLITIIASGLSAWLWEPMAIIDGDEPLWLYQPPWGITVTTGDQSNGYNH